MVAIFVESNTVGMGFPNLIAMFNLADAINSLLNGD